jgi:hypothetical protein
VPTRRTLNYLSAEEGLIDVQPIAALEVRCFGLPREEFADLTLVIFESITQVKMKLCKLQKYHCDEQPVNQILLCDEVRGTGDKGVPIIKLEISFKYVVSFIAVLM